MVWDGRIARGARVLMVATALAAAGISCSDGKGGGPGGAGTSGQGGGAGMGTAGSGGGGAGGATAGRGGTGGSGGDPFAGAIPIVIGGSATSGTLADPLTSRDVYSFAGTMGETIQIVTSTGAANPFDPTYLDLAITLYDSPILQIAQQADPWPRVSNAPTLFTVLPTTGTYYLVVEHCAAVPIGPCVYPGAGLTNRGYTVSVSDIAGAAFIREGGEPGNGGLAGAAAVTYTKLGGSSYVPLLLHGVLQNANDQDTFTFTVPADVPVAPGARARANFWFQPTREDGNGSSYAVGTIYVVDPADTSGTHLVEIDATDYGTGDSPNRPPGNMSFPVQLGKQYALVVTHSQFSPEPLRDFYFMQHLSGAPAGAPLMEIEPNNTQATADTLAPINNQDGTYTFSVDGDLTTVATDVDFHHLQIPSGPKTLTGECESQLNGSGVAQFRLQLLGSDGTVLLDQTETGGNRTIGTFPIPASGVGVRLSGYLQYSNVTNSSYVCRFVAVP